MNKLESIEIVLISSCCNDGYGYSTRLYKVLEPIVTTLTMSGFSYDTTNTYVIKYKLTIDQCPKIILDELNMIFDAQEVDNPDFVKSIITKIGATK